MSQELRIKEAIKILFLFIIYITGETEIEVLETLRLIKRSGVLNLYFSGWQILNQLD